MLIDTTDFPPPKTSPASTNDHSDAGISAHLEPDHEYHPITETIVNHEIRHKQQSKIWEGHKGISRARQIIPK